MHTHNHSHDKDFVHLHLHTEYSLLDGFAQIKHAVKRAVDLNMDALAITDHGTMFGVIDFYRACKSAGIKPIIGVEAYLARRGMRDRDPQKDRQPYHLLLLAKDETGYKNLLKIASASQLDGYYYRPRIDKEFLAAHADGIIATSGCLAAEIPRMVEQGRDDEALQTIGWYQDVFGKDNFFLELQQHDIPELERLNKWLLENKKHADVPLVATNDVHYVNLDDHDVHDTLLCIQTSALKREPKANRLAMTDPSYHLRSQLEMWEIFGDIAPEALHNTRLITDMCNIHDLDGEGYHLPIFPVPERFDNPEQYLRYLCERGVEWRYGNKADSKAVQDRLEHELNIILKMGFATYFLIVWDLVEFARSADIWWNVRGSGAGSLVAYSLGITNLDPLENALIFERFLNPHRKTMPDFDLDFPEDRRQEMIEYCARKYGEDKVAAIITFGTLKPKAAIRDVGRALDLPLPEVNRIAKMVPTVPKPPSIDQLLGKDDSKLDAVNPELVELYEQDRFARDVLNYAAKVEGVPRHAGTHAAGIIVADKPLVEYIPLHRPTSSSAEDAPVKQVTQFPMETAESIGLLKIDFLGLSTLTIMRRACELIEQHHGIKYDMSNIPYKPDPDDPEITRMVEEMFEMMGRGETIGVFQLESSGMRQMLLGMRPQTFEHIIAAISLYRPGPMQFIPQFNSRLHGEESVQYLHEKLEPIISNTYGIITYQEQIMQIAMELFGYDAGEADLMRRAVSKKKEKDLAKHRNIFLERGPEHGVDEESAGKIFDDIEYFANYGFNKCLVGSTEIIDPNTGRMVTVGDMASGKASLSQTLTMDTDNLRLKIGDITDVINNGIKPVYRLTTQTGRQIEATANHPFYTFEGWRLLGDLEIGERVAVPRQIPVEGQNEWPDHKLIVLGHLLAEGNLCHPTGLYFYTGDEIQWKDYVYHLEKFDNTVATTHCRRNMYEIYSKRIDRRNLAGVVKWIEDLGLRNTTSHTKFIPDEVFELNNRQIALLIARMWEGDGNIDENNRFAYYANSSERMARQLQHLFLRLGIVTRLREVNFPYKDGRIGYQLFITGNDRLARFAKTIGIHFVSMERQQTLNRMILDMPASMSSKDIVPIAVKHIIRREKAALGVTWNKVANDTGLSITSFNRVASGTKSGLTHAVVSQLADYFESDELQVHADNDIYWDQIVSIEYVGEQTTYDLTIAETHNFVANDFIVHNSHAADYAVITCQTAFLKCHYPHEYMSALMSIHKDDTDKISIFVADAKRMGIDILPPNINKSWSDFDIEADENDQRHIRFGLGAIKNLGLGAVDYIIQERESGGAFKDLDDFLDRCSASDIGKRGLESAIKVGAFDDFGDRPTLLYNVDKLVKHSVERHKAAEVGQVSMFDILSDNGVDNTATSIASVLEEPPNPADKREQLRWEKDLVGMYVTDHPLEMIMDKLDNIITHNSHEIREAGAILNGRDVTIAGLVMNIRNIITKNGDSMAILQVEDIGGKIDCVMFPRTWGTYRDLVEEDRVLVVRGKAEDRQSEMQIIVDSVSQNFDVAYSDELEELRKPDFSWLPPEDSSPDDNPFFEDMPAYIDDDLDEDDDEEDFEDVVEDEEPVEEEIAAELEELETVEAQPESVAEATEEPGESLEEEPIQEPDLPEPPPEDEDHFPPPPEEDDFYEPVDDFESYASPTEQPTNGRDAAGRLIAPPAAAAVPRKVTTRQQLIVTLYRSGDDERDYRLLRWIYSAAMAYPGGDELRIYAQFPGEEERLAMDFPDLTILVCDALINKLKERLGDNCVVIRNL